VKTRVGATFQQDFNRLLVTIKRGQVQCSTSIRRKGMQQFRLLLKELLKLFTFA
jgi:hypothetical protein